jgi:DUF1680 family protein
MRMLLLDRPTPATFAFGGLIGERIAANQRHWLLPAPTSNPAILTMFRDRDARLNLHGLPVEAPDGQSASERLLVWSGEYAGKYLISAVQGFRLTRDQHLLGELREFVAGLIGFQAPDGYLGPFEAQQRMTGHKVSGDALWDLWGQYHCMLGLYYWFKETGDTAALDACKSAANLLSDTFLGNTLLETDVTVWEFSRENGPVLAPALRLLPDRDATGGPDWGRGTIAGHSHPNEVRWKWDGPTLVFLAQNGDESTRFNWGPPPDPVLTGKFLFDPSITHRLKRLHSPAPLQNQAVAHILALLHAETRDPTYLQLLRKFEAAWKAVGGNYVDGFQGSESFFQNLSARRWESLHSVQAVAELFLVTGDQKYLRAFRRIWTSIRERDRHNTGGFSSLEMATGNPYDPRPIETCATVAWIALTIDMLRLTADPTVADELELSTWNAGLGAQSPDGRWWTYDTPMGGVPTGSLGAVKLPAPLGDKPPAMLGERRPARYDLHFQDTATRGTSHLSCCAANGPRALGALSEWAVMIADDGAITLNFYGPSVFTVRAPSGRDVSLVQETDYPVSGRIVLSIVPAAVESFRLRLRIPSWSHKTVVRLNGADQSVKSGTYLTFDRAWTPGDTIELLLDMSTRFEDGGPPPPDADAYGGSTVEMVSVYRGPLLLAYDRRLNTFDPMRVPPLVRSVPPTSIAWPPRTPGPMVLLQFSSVKGPIALCDFVSAGFDFPPRPHPRPNPYRGWRFSRGDGSVIAKHIHLERDGTISGHSNPNEARWGFEGDVLVFYAQDRRPSTRFTWVSLDEGRQQLRGVFLFDRRIVHVLSEDDTIDWTRVWQFGRADGWVITERLLLQVDGRIVGHTHANEVRWDTDGGRLVFYAQDGRASTRFNWVSRENGQRVLRGTFLFDRSITHVLEELDTSVFDKTWEFVRAPNTVISGNVRLLPGGAISGHSHPNEARWGFEGDTLVFYSAQGAASTRFTSIQMQHGRPAWSGRFAFDPSLTHVLRERDFDVTSKLWRFVRKSAVPRAAIDVRLLPDTQIEGGDHPNESWWGVDSGDLVFRGRNGTITTRFNKFRVDVADDAFDFRGVPDVERRMIRSGRVTPQIRHELRESNIDLGWGGGSRYVSWIPISEASVGFQIPRARFAPIIVGNRLMIVTADGRVFARKVGRTAVGASRELSGPPVAANPWDRWLLPIGNRIVVVVNDGNVFAHDVTGDTISLATHLGGPRVASNDQDMWVVTMGSRILVIVNDGAVFAHDIVGNSIGTAVPLSGPPVAANPPDKWVVTMGNRVFVIVNDGAVFAHDIIGDTIAPAVHLSAPPVARNPADRWVLTVGSRIVVIVNDGRIFAHDITGSTVAPAVQLA